MWKRGAILIGFIPIVLLSLAFSSVTQAAVPATPSISISPASIEVAQGDTFTIEIVVDPKGNEIYAVQYDLYFDNNLLKAISQNRGTLLSQDGTDTIEVINEINNSIGKVEYGETRTGRNGVSNVGVMASISFEVVGASGTSYLKLSNVKLYNKEGTKVENVVVNHGTCTVGNATGKHTAADITVEEAHKMLEEKPEDIILLDVRTEEEYNIMHIKEAKLIPLSDLESKMSELNKSKIIIVYCKTGGRSRTASEILVQNGFEHVYNMLGGIKAWSIHFPVFKLPTPAITAAPSPTSTVSPAVSPLPREKRETPGFEAIKVIMGLLAMAYLLTKRIR